MLATTVPGRTAVLVGHERHVEHALAAAGQPAAWAFSLTSGAAGLPARPSAVGSLFAAGSARELFDRIIVGPDVPLYEGGLTDAVLLGLARMLVPGGTIALAPSALRGAPGLGQTSRPRVEHLLGGTLADAGGLLELTPRGVAHAPGSVLGWMLANAIGLAQALVVGRASRPALFVDALDDMLLEVMLDDAESAVMSPRRRLAERDFTGGDRWLDRLLGEIEPIDYEAAVTTTLNQLAVLAVDAARRAALVRRLVAEADAAAPAQLLDLGGGFGLTAAELVAAGDVATAVTRDPASTHDSMALALYRPFRDVLGGRWLLSTRPAASFAFDRTHTHVLVPPSVQSGDAERDARLLARCWEVLEPGGALIVEEWQGDALPGRLEGEDRRRRFHPVVLAEIHGREVREQAVTVVGKTAR